MHRVKAALGTALVAACSTIVASASPAAADRGGFAQCGQASCDSGAHSDDERSNGSGERSGPKTEEQTDCYLHRLDPFPADTEVYDETGILLGVGSGPGTWYYRVCNGSSEGALLSGNPLVFVPDPNPEALRHQALQQLTFPAPEIVTSPPADKLQLVNMKTWLSVRGSWRTLSSTAEVPGVSVTVTAEPARVLWDMGNGDRVVCDGPGSTYDSSRDEKEQAGSCFYRWRLSSAGEPNGAYQVTATVQWSVSWTVTGAAGGGALPVMQQSTTRALRVGEAQARSAQT